MLAVGLLVPSQGRLGKNWKYAEALKDLAEYARPQPSREMEWC